MSIRVALSHRTTYRYEKPALLGSQVVRLRPAPHTRTPLLSYSLQIEPKQHFLNWQQDPQGNFLARVVVPERTKLFSVSVDLVADLEAIDPFDFFLEESAEKYPFDYAPALARELTPYLVRGEHGPLFKSLLGRLDLSSRRTVDFLVDVNRALREAVDYVIRMEPGVQTPEETLEKGRGSCRDSSWLLVHLLRELGIAARFVSGYLIQLVPDQKPLEGPPGPEADFTDLHAWCEAYVPGAGWIGLDPTSGLFAAEGHIPLACSPEPSSAAPIEGGLFEKTETDFQFEMAVKRVIDRPRVTKPYTEAEWRALVARGKEVDRRLYEGDVRLTMGGEPTFVSSQEPDGPEWNTAALGGRKQEMGDRLLRRLHGAWQPGGFLFHGQGKWYPGEPLPRWALSCFFRHDGVRAWQDPSLIAVSGANHGHGSEEAARFVKRLEQLLSLEQPGTMPAYEDVWYHLWRERRLPTNVDPLQSRLDDAQERERLARIFRQGLGSVVGYVLPLAHRGGWVSGRWFLRDEHCFLIPGDSAAGFRLPLDSQPWAEAGDRGFEPALDPFQQRPPLPRQFTFPVTPRGAQGGPPTYDRPAEPRLFDRGRAGLADGSRAAGPRAGLDALGVRRSAPTPFESASGIVHTALVAEPRQGILRIFMPPVETLEAYLELVAAIERTAQELAMPVQLEGYPPPEDPRLGNFKVTPDPGVIEVNVPFVRTFTELVQQTETLYEEARAEQLIAEKFEHDGAHIGSGGGNHFVMGGATAADSPFLRRPDLLASLVSFWHNHPALSYLFSGRFIGPTSQAPRPDEARDDSVHELSLAISRLPPRGADCPPWLVDRIFRNLLVDVTGNTHRTELCIDKLYSPDGPTGRLGLVELRSFEMPPHARMSSATQLLIRALLASFWERPYQQPLVKWGTQVHDRFLLPYFVDLDFQDVLGELQRRGIELDLAWFRPHFEFRFPILGSVVKDATTLELRSALEPWPVLGEESAAGGQSRYVDSSLERVQVRLFGIAPERHLASVNGVELPLQPTGTRGEYVCGVRYRAWQPPSCLHPTIGVHGPLHFDLYDRWNERSIAGATYHVVHAGGRASFERPVNAAAAEGRRIARFNAFGHTQGQFRPEPAPVNPDFPMTLDLRWIP
ncbi:MAG TPA: transglutaminase family protein [Polyangiaceae bacterium]|nr:transglutaminase family protein [Polyangiaceae bacterium]